MCTGSGLITRVVRLRLPYAEYPVSGTRMHAGAYHSMCSARACVQGALMRRGRVAGVGATPWVPGGGVWHRWWTETVGSPAHDGAQLGGVRATQGITPGTVRTVLANPGVECSPDLPRGLRRLSESTPISHRRVGRHRQRCIRLARYWFEVHHGKIGSPVRDLSYGTYLPQGIYGTRILFFVSARTNKRHHHHHQ